MNENLTFFILSTSGAPVKQATFSKNFLRFLSVICLAIVGVVGYGAYDYYHLKLNALDNGELKRKISHQFDEISVQRKQIQVFAGEINQLKTKLVSLRKFEKKIRMVASLDKADDKDSLFGIGGSMPEDLDTTLDLTEKHNGLIREMHDQVEQLELATINQHKSFEILLDSLNDQRNLLASTPAIQPTKGWITSTFGYRKSPFTGKREFHKGLDIANKAGTPILAPADGVVTFAGVKGFFGKLMIIDHGYGMVTRYAHIRKFLKQPGEAVKRGDIIAEVGSTGRTTGPHLHYEVLVSGAPVNPEKYILD